MARNPQYIRSEMRTDGSTVERHRREPRLCQPLLIAGGEGTLGTALVRACVRFGLPRVALGRAQLDITRPEQVKAALDEYRPSAVLNAAGYVDVAGAETHPRQCLRENTVGPLVLAKECASRGIPLVLFSSVMVFGGGIRGGDICGGSGGNKVAPRKRRHRPPYRESDVPQPLGVYARSKARMERFVQALMPEALIIRTSALFGPFEKESFVTAALCELAHGDIVYAADDAYLTPAYLPDMCDQTLKLVAQGASGVRHLAHPEPITRFGMIARAAHLAGLSTRRLRPLPSAAVADVEEQRDFTSPDPAHGPSALATPSWAVLSSEHGTALPSLDDALRRFVNRTVAF